MVEKELNRYLSVTQDRTLQTIESPRLTKAKKNNNVKTHNVIESLNLRSLRK